MWEYNQIDELYHHGIVGMKWGVRRYQNQDGSLTDKGKKRFRDVENSKFKSSNATRLAKHTLNKNKKTSESNAKYYAKRSVKELEKAGKYAEGTDEHNKHVANSEKFAAESKKLSKVSELCSKKVKDIDSGKLKAGRDFIVQVDMNVALSKIGETKYILDSIKDVTDINQTSDWTMWGGADYKIIEASSKKKDR